jgi:uncharacterized protein (DUF1684 family)
MTFAAAVLALFVTSAAPPDTFEARTLADRKETVAFFHAGPMSPLAAIVREDFARAGGDAITLGAAADNRIVLPGLAPHHLRVTVEGAGFRVVALDSAFTVGTEAKREAVLPPSAIGAGPYRVRLSYQNAPAVIVFDPARAKASTFTGPRYYPYDARYRFVVPLASDSRKDTVLIESTHGPLRPALRVGRFALAFPGGKTVRLAAYRLLEPGVGDDALSLFFMDATNGKGSYHGGRYVDAAPVDGGRWLVDLNGAYNPSCAYSPFYNCPIPPKENRLTVAIPVGESWEEK